MYELLPQLSVFNVEDHLHKIYTGIGECVLLFYKRQKGNSGSGLEPGPLRWVQRLYGGENHANVCMCVCMCRKMKIKERGLPQFLETHMYCILLEACQDQIDFELTGRASQ